MVIESTQALGAAIRVRRKYLRLTQLDLAELAGVSVRFLSDLERGKPSVQLGVTLRVVHALGWRLDAGVGGPSR